MGTIIGSGIGSGLDVAGLVAKLVEAEGRPQSVRLDSQEAKAQAKLSALGMLRSALDAFRSALGGLKDIDKFRGRAVTRSSEDFVAVTASSSASPASYEIEVRQLATRHKLASGPVASADTVIGTGTLTITQGAESFTVTIDGTNGTLAGIAAAINDAGENTGVAATVITADDGAHLVLSATETGADHAITVAAADGDGGLAALAYDGAGPGVDQLVEVEAAQNAIVRIDGFEATSASNTVSGAIAGVEIDLLAVNEDGETTTVAVDYDRQGARKQIEELVESYNALLEAVAKASAFDPATRTSAPLAGDATLRNISFRLRNELNAAVANGDSPFSLLSQIGVTTDLNGKLNIDSARLDEAFAADFDAVGELFAAEQTGVAVRLDALLEPYLQTGGILDDRNEGLRATIDDIADRREALQLRLAAVEERLLRQFNALDGLLAQLQSTSNFLAQQLANLPGVKLFDKD